MNPRRFLVSFSATLVLLSPFFLNARSPVAPPSRLDQPAPFMLGPTAQAGGIPFSTKILRQGDGFADVQVLAHNTSEETVAATFTVAVMRPAPMEQLSRVPMRPANLASREISVQLKPGEKYEQRLSFTGSKLAGLKKLGENAAILAGPNMTSPPFAAIWKRPAPQKTAQLDK